MKPRFGLMRAKEFLMKDLYSFDVDRDCAIRSYEQMRGIYKDLLDTIGVPYVEVQADTGDMGGSLSHEFQYPAGVGEDLIVTCPKCTYSSNVELCLDVTQCPNCKFPKLKISQGIEVAHTFLLDDKYTKVMGATYLQTTGKPAPLIMGCYGIGITRLIAASVECLSHDNEIRWPFVLAPFNVCIIPPKDGSKEQQAVHQYIEQIYNQLNGIDDLNDQIIVDDRCNLTIGKRLMEAKRYMFIFP